MENNDIKKALTIGGAVVGGIVAAVGLFKLGKHIFSKTELARRVELEKKYRDLEKEKSEDERMQRVMERHTIDIDKICNMCVDPATGALKAVNGYTQVDFDRINERSQQLSVFIPNIKSSIFYKEMQMQSVLARILVMDQNHPYYKLIFRKKYEGT